VSYCLILSLIALVGAAGPKSASDDLILQFRDGTTGERADAKRSLLREHGKPLPAALQKDLFRIFAQKNLPGEVRVDAMIVLLEANAALAGFEEELRKIAAATSEPVEVRVSAVMGLQIILRNHAGTPEPTNLLFKLLTDQNESAVIRLAVGNALLGNAALREKLIDAVTRIVESGNESFDARSQVMRLIPFTILSTPKKNGSVTSLLMRLSADDAESTHFRVETLNCLAGILVEIEFDSIEMIQTSEQLSRALVKVLADSKTHRRIREAAGQTLGTCPKADSTLVADLNGILISQERFIHPFAAGALGSIGAEAKSSVPHLIRIRNDMQEKKETREAAEKALLAIDPETAGRLGIQGKE